MAMFELRPYQQAALTALEDYWRDGGGNPLVVMATGTGKSVIIAHLIRDISRRYPPLRVLVVTHVLELIEQDLIPLRALWPDAPIGINSRGVGEREWGASIIFAGVQSVWRSAARLGPRHLVLIDEAHLVPHDGDGMYRTLLAELRTLAPADGMRIAGFSATPFRLDSGRLDEGEGKIFDAVVFDYGIGQGIRDGWLSPLTSKTTGTEINISSVGRRGGEFIAGELERAADDDATVSAACDEIMARGVDRRSWLVFCCGVAHAHHVGQALCNRGISCRVVTGETPLAEREDSIAAFKAGMVRCLVNVNVLTTGFDAPRIDLLAMLRPTLSTGLYLQMVGRGTRKAEGKTNCLILDFAGNCRRHGPVDQVDITVGGNNSTAVAPTSVQAKTCPECDEINPLHATMCCCCGHEWPKPKPAAKHATCADAVPILTGERVWLPVTDISFHRHYKYGDPGAPPSFRVDYLCGLSPYAEYVSFERQGYPRICAERWWYAMGGSAHVPATVNEALQRQHELDPVVAIAVARNGRFWNVTDRRVWRSDGSVVEVDRHYRCWVIETRADAARALAATPINDAILF
jgi:DNA repair protein RadD